VLAQIAFLFCPELTNMVSSHFRLVLALIMYAALMGVVVVTKPRAMFDSMGAPYTFGTSDGQKTMGLLPFAMLSAALSLLAVTLPA
jgi:hypothetical protein